MGSITEAIGYINAKPVKLTKAIDNMYHISVTDNLKKARKNHLKSVRDNYTN